jgi:uncharacterized protein (DUF924 family)
VTSRIDEILSFWFEEPDGTAGKSRKVWFVKNPDFDAEIRTRFLVDYEQAAAGSLDSWQNSAPGSLALILLLDQFPRNLFRGTPQAFATDGKALVVAQAAIARGFDQALPPIQRTFIYMPFMHSENLEIQHRSVELFRPLAEDPETRNSYVYAIKHLEVIQRFGRFPHRNAILDRANILEETEFLKQPGSSF